MAGAHKEEESLKKHGDVLDRAMQDADRQATEGNGKSGGVQRDSIPMPEQGSHEKSHAAHLGGNVHDHTKPEGNLRHGAAPGELREPPQEVGRIGKEHRKQ